MQEILQISQGIVQWVYVMIATIAVTVVLLRMSRKPISKFRYAGIMLLASFMLIVGKHFTDFNGWISNDGDLILAIAEWFAYAIFLGGAIFGFNPKIREK